MVDWLAGYVAAFCEGSAEGITWIEARAWLRMVWCYTARSAIDMARDRYSGFDSLIFQSFDALIAHALSSCPKSLFLFL